MPTSDRRLVRIGVRLEAAYNAAQSNSRNYLLPSNSWSDADNALRRWNAATSRQWSLAAERERVALVAELESIERQVRHLAYDLKSERRPAVPSLRLLLEELQATAAEFGDLVWEEGEIGVTTDPVTLDDIELGRFQIRLQLDRVGTDAPYRVRALEPNPAASCSDTTHPHVNGERLCAGEGRGAIAAALAEGRLFDFFMIVNRILHTYALGSAYTELENWHGVSCQDCDSSIDADDACACTHCDQRVCGDCLCCCNGCGDGYCSGCIDRCYRCEEPTCSECLAACRHCRRNVCESCRDDGVCETCREELEEKADEDELEAAPVEAQNPSAEPAF